jgi:hypothetical protein
MNKELVGLMRRTPNPTVPPNRRRKKTTWPGGFFNCIRYNTVRSIMHTQTAPSNTPEQSATRIAEFENVSRIYSLGVRS